MTDQFDVFFFQAEDGIRDLVRSRGLGDVYKRQAMAQTFPLQTLLELMQNRTDEASRKLGQLITAEPVSYTHLTLPTSDLV